MPSEPSFTLPSEVAEQATWLDERVALLETEAPFPSSNSLLTTDGQATVLVDAGLGSDALAALAPLVDELVLTHFHLDHVLCFDELPELPVTVPEAELAIFQGEPFPSFVDAPPEMAELFEESLGDIYPAFDLDPGTFGPGDVLDLAGTRWEVVAAPGHSPGHPFLHEPDLGILFSVDVEFSGLGPWYAWPHCDPTRFEQAVAEARPLFEAARVVATSHSPPIVDDPEQVGKALDAFQAHYEQRDRALHQALEARGKQGATVDELVEEVAIFYGDHLESYPHLAYWSGVMTDKHLERLAADGAVEARGSRWFVHA